VKRNRYIGKLLPRMLNYWLARSRIFKPAGPITLTFSVTNRCQSRCLTCKIWQLYRDHPARADEELTLEEIEKIFRSMDPIYFFNLSGGEPFLRSDLPEIVELAIEHLKPEIVHTPTNALAPARIAKSARRICEMMQTKAPGIPFTVKPSLDGVGKQHDQIRGVPGNWEKLLDTIDRLKALSTEFDNLHVEVGTVVSRANVRNLREIARFAHTLGIESYRNEIAEEREEFFNLGDPITPTARQYRDALAFFASQTRKSMGSKRALTQLTESLRLVYYNYAAKILATKRQVLPCYAGISNAHLNPYGDLWPCCVLGYAKPLGNLRDADYDFRTVWHSKQANRVRSFIRTKGCACPLANQSYSNILMNPLAAARAALNLLAVRLQAPETPDDAGNKG